jgi:hypothetical protein
MIVNAPISPRFLAELKAIYDQPMVASPTPSATPALDLDWLTNEFRNWRTRQQERLRVLLNGLPDNDPLFCPVSLFGTMDFGRLETAHTRTLAWLLDPGKEHGFRDHLLRALLREVGGPETNFFVETVASEFPISRDEDSGRLDVIVKGRGTGLGSNPASWLLVIEGKVDAMEGHEQLSRYDAWIERFEPDRKVYRVFLTPQGHEAETGGGWRTMSFLQLVCVLRVAMPELREAPGYHFLRYYLAGVLMDVCGWKLPIKPDTDDPYGVVQYMDEILKHVGTREASNGVTR